MNNEIITIKERKKYGICPHCKANNSHFLHLKINDVLTSHLIFECQTCYEKWSFHIGVEILYDVIDAYNNGKKKLPNWFECFGEAVQNELYGDEQTRELFRIIERKTNRWSSLGRKMKRRLNKVWAKTKT